VYPAYAAPEVTNKSRGHLHDSPLQILVERGVLGLAAWLWLFGAFAAIAGFLVAGLFEHNFGDTEVLLVAMFVMAITLAIDRDVSPA
jgi:O-antigen ligase